MQNRKSHVLSVGDIELHYETSGRGQPLLMLHGFTGCSTDWNYAGGDRFADAYSLIMPDARGHGRSTRGSKEITHGECARDVLALLDQLQIMRCRAVGVSMGANILLHIATLAPERLEAMVLVSGTMYFPEQARRIMRALSPEPAPEDWTLLRVRHVHGDDQIRALWAAQRKLAESYNDMCFTTSQLACIEARTLVVAGDRDPLYPLSMAVEMREAIPDAQLWVVPGAGHAPVFLEAAEGFADLSLRFLGR